MRIVGSSLSVPVSKKGTFAFDSIPPGDLSIVYSSANIPQARFKFSTIDSRDIIAVETYIPESPKDVEWAHPACQLLFLQRISLYSMNFSFFCGDDGQEYLSVIVMYPHNISDEFYNRKV